jgi:5-methylcytosine-specific restriction endonuclease McrA
MTFDEYINKITTCKKISNVKLQILRRLWESDDNSFPKRWVSSVELLEITGQKYFDRRARELRDQHGCDIETKHSGEMSGHAWRINSLNLAVPQDREYLTSTQKQALFSRSENKCSICGKIAEAGVRGLQADHKIPLSRGAGNELDNWQAICNVCNVGKRRACEGCTMECKSCPWAFPELVGITTVITIDEKVLSDVGDYSKEKNITVSKTFEIAAINLLDQDK